MTIRHVTIKNNFGEGIYVGSVEPDEPVATQVAMGNEHSHITIDDVTIVSAGANGGQGDGIDCKYGLTYVTIEDVDISAYRTGNGINLPQTFIDTDQHILIQDCYIHDATADNTVGKAIMGGATVNYGQWGERGITVRNCVIANSHMGIYIYQSDQAANLDDVYVYNNTVYGTTSSAGLNIGVDSNALIENNLVYDNNGYNGVQASISGANVTSDYNAWYNPSGTGWGYSSEGSHSIAMTAAQAAACVTNAAAENFTLLAGSVAINHGVAISSFADDYLGTLRPQGGAWDIGAYEYVGS